MASIITDAFRIKNSLDFIETVIQENVFLTLGNTLPWGGNDLQVPFPKDSKSTTQVEHWDDTFFLRKLTRESVVNMIPRYGYDSVRIYDKYDPNDPDIFRKRFHTTVLDNNSVPPVYRVYKCIENGGGAESDAGSPPVGNNRDLIIKNDGYVWKFMFSVTVEDQINFLTDNFVPVRDNKNPANVIVVSGQVNPRSNDGVVGHGYDPVRELGAYYINANVRLNKSEEGFLVTENDYRKIGLNLNPLEANGASAMDLRYRQTRQLKLTQGTNPEIFQVDEILQAANGATARVIERRQAEDALIIDTLPISGIIPAGTTVTGQTTSNTARVNTVVELPLKKYSGEFLFMEYRELITRNGAQAESISVILEF